VNHVNTHICYVNIKYSYVIRESVVHTKLLPYVDKYSLHMFMSQALYGRIRDDESELYFSNNLRTDP
jgi:hypothetical protein